MATKRVASPNMAARTASGFKRAYVMANVWSKMSGMLARARGYSRFVAQTGWFGIEHFLESQRWPGFG